MLADSLCDMDIAGVERWDVMSEFRRDLQHDYLQVFSLSPLVYNAFVVTRLILALFRFVSKQIDRDGSGYIELAELKQALDICGFKIPQYKVRQMIDEVDRDQSGPGKGRLSFDEFEVLCARIKSQDVATTFKKNISKRENLETIGGTSDASSEGTTHSVNTLS